MLTFLTVAVIVCVVLTMLNEGLLTAITACVNVMLSGLVAFNFYEPCADELEKLLTPGFLSGTEDAVAMAGLFALSMGLLRLVTNNLANEGTEMPALLQQIATGAVAAMAGYLLAGFLTVMVSTLPLSERFLGHDPAASPDDLAGLQKVLPADRVWLGLMHGMGKGPFARAGAKTFDPEGTFPLRHARLRRIKEQGVP